jgi:hypothetical protein
MKQFCLQVHQLLNSFVTGRNTQRWAAHLIANDKPSLADYRVVNSNGDRLIRAEKDHTGKRLILFFERSV